MWTLEQEKEKDKIKMIKVLQRLNSKKVNIVTVISSRVPGEKVQVPEITGTWMKSRKFLC